VSDTPINIGQLAALTLVRIQTFTPQDRAPVLREFGQACSPAGAASGDAEVGRYREALEQIAYGWKPGEPIDMRNNAEIARLALTNGGGE